MADDSNAKPPPLPEIIEETNWPPFLRRLVTPDQGERARRAQQATDERAQQAADAAAEEQRELERKQRAREQTELGRDASLEKRRQKRAIVIKAAEAVAVKKTPGQVTDAALKQINTDLKLEIRNRDGSPCQMTRLDVYYIVNKNWAEITADTSLRKR
jgi:hypothetical protein